MDAVEEVKGGKGYVTVCGAGYVGLSLTAVYLRAGMKVILVDINENKLNKISQKKLNYIEKEVEEAINRALDEGRLVLTSDCTKASSSSKVIVVTVPVYFEWLTKKINYTYFKNAVESIGKGLRRGSLVIVESSVPPGTTEKVVLPLLEEASGLKGEEDFYLVYSPERIYVGRAVKDIEERYPKIIAGIGPHSSDLGRRFYKDIAKKGVIILPRPRDAEFEKLAEGVYRDVNIALANELALLAMKLGVDFYAAREAANTQPYSHIHLPGPGVGGTCIPIYPYFLMLESMKEGFIPDLILTGRRINEAMPIKVVNLIEEIATLFNFDRNKDKVAILGVAFRGDTDDTRLSPSHDVIGLLKARGFNNIVAHDPYVLNDDVLNNLGVALTQKLDEALKNAKLVVVLTRHSYYSKLSPGEIARLAGGEPLIIDIVNILKYNDKYTNLIVFGKPIIIPEEKLSTR
jgi:nucleotide sugar dehydrogenase